MVSGNCAESNFGTVRIELPESHSELTPGLERACQVATARHVYRWVPSDTLRGELPADFELRFNCLTDKDGLRRFYPTLGSEGLISMLFAGGLAISIKQNGLSGEQARNSRMKFLLFQKMRKLNNRQQRKFQGIKDLYIKRPGRSDKGQRNVLPDSLGMNSDCDDFPWGMNKLRIEGEKLARAYGYNRPSMHQTIEYGLFAAARSRPLMIEEPEQVEGLLRIALYNEQNTCDCDFQTREWIEGEVVAATDAHLNDSQDDFNEWFWGSKNSFLKQIARKRCPYGNVTNPMVRKVLLDLGWQAYTYVADCIHAQMCNFQNALLNPLNKQERQIYEMLYQKQSYLANLPLLLLYERIPFLKAPMLAVLNGQNDFEFAGTVHQLLYYYSQMSDSRRGADRLIQDFHVSCRSQNRPIKILEFDESCPVEDNGKRRKYKPLYDEDNQGWGD
ncbi:hypothetical protein MalM14_40460 [Gimesia chilikensis]|nr:hypothetical protein MalM14_40460 [Gimesia chilikensis]